MYVGWWAADNDKLPDFTLVLFCSSRVAIVYWTKQESESYRSQNLLKFALLIRSLLVFLNIEMNENNYYDTIQLNAYNIYMLNDNDKVFVLLI